MTTAIDCANSIEQTLAANTDLLHSFINTVSTSTCPTLDNIIEAISKINPLPQPLSTKHLQRSTKRNVYPTLITTTIRLLCGTFGWQISQHPTSLDLALNQIKNQPSGSIDGNHCICDISAPSFSLDLTSSCSICGKQTPYISTASRIHFFHNTQTPPNDSSASPSHPTTTIKTTSLKNRKRTDRMTQISRSSHNDTLRDITNIPPDRHPLCSAARQDTVELNAIIKKNFMLSNFVVTYFFKNLQLTFPNILFKEFLFDFVKRDGGWHQFVQFSRQEGHSIDFLEQLKNSQSTCIVPICHSLHWTLLVRKYVNSSWIIYYIDSMLHGSDDRMRQWRDLFDDNDLFSGTWIKAKVIPQSELECGARVCLHLLCFALSSHNAKEIGRQLQRFPDLAARSRLLVSGVCSAGKWNPQGWLKPIIGTPQPIISDF